MKLFLLIGQSNMSGRGNVEVQDKVENPRISMLTKDLKWVPAKDPLHFDKPIAGVGPGSEFARGILKANPDATIGLIPSAAWRVRRGWETRPFTSTQPTSARSANTMPPST